MRLARADLGELTYCTNIHAGESWAEVFSNLERHLVPVRDQVAPGERFGIGLRLSAIAAAELARPDAFRDFERFLADNDLYVFTINGFPYGPFHGVRVKEEVYQPDWTHEERLAYTDLLADLLARLLPEGGYGSVSTVPGTFKPLATGAAVEAIADTLIRHVAHLVELERSTGRTIALALEPEPFCFLETIDETVLFFERRLFSGAAAERLAKLSDISTAAAGAALRRHLGVCYDVCHAAVEYEDPAESLEALRAAGIGVPKLQLSSALRIERVDEEAARRLGPFDDGVYLHQTIARQGGGALTRHLDLKDAFAALDEERGSEWRVHFHVPVFLEEMEQFGTTQPFLSEILDLHLENPISPHLEVETYTWDVLPEAYRTSSVADAVARELAWVLNRLAR